MVSINPKDNNLIKLLIIVASSVFLGMIGATSLQLNVRTEEKVTTITLEPGSFEISETAEPIKLEEVEGTKFDLGTLNARGEFFRTDTYGHFIDDTWGHCVSEGNYWGSQCVSLAQAFWTNYAGYGLSDCGTGSARGIWYCKDDNARDEFMIISKGEALQPGDWVVFDSGTWGHIGMVYEYPEDNYIPLYGENQGGKKCEEGGSQPNFILLSDKTLLGAFRPKAYIIYEPELEAPDTGVSK